MAKPRIRWLDSARGLAIVMVVCYHGSLFVTALGYDDPLVRALSDGLGIVRMPLFFAVSGILLATASRRSWGDAWRHRVANWIWLYLVWSLVVVLCFSIFPWHRGVPPGGSLIRLLDIVIAPRTGLWYLLALAIFFSIQKLTQPLPRWLLLVLAMAASTAVTANVVDAQNFAFNNMLKYWMFYVLGSMVGRQGGQFVEARTTAILGLVSAAAGTVVIGLAMTLIWAGVPLGEIGDFPFMFGATAVAALVASVCLSALASRYVVFTWLERWGSFTLPIYVTHETVLGLLSALIDAAHVNLVNGVLGTTLLATVGLAVCLVLRPVLQRVPGALVAPQWWSRGERTDAVAQPRRAAEQSTDRRNQP